MSIVCRMRHALSEGEGRVPPYVPERSRRAVGDTGAIIAPLQVRNTTRSVPIHHDAQRLRGRMAYARCAAMVAWCNTVQHL